MSKQKQSTGEFVTLMALLMSLVALSIDSMLPALSTIAKDYNIQNSNSAQLIILVFFVGISIGQLFFGPYSDTNGRKKAIYMGVGLYLIGCTVSLLAPTFFILICGRFLQGIGVASCRVISQAIIRDLYEGRSMARIMSIIMTIFILVPALAPSIGQGILVLFNWHAIFILSMVMSCICTVWLYLD